MYDILCTVYCVKRFTCDYYSNDGKNDLQIGGTHWHKLFILQSEKNLTPHRLAELSIIKLLQSPKEPGLIKTINVIFSDEIGQISAEMLATFDIISRRIRDSNLLLGGVLLIFTIDHTQNQPIGGTPLLTSCHMLLCFKMVVSYAPPNRQNFFHLCCQANYNKCLLGQLG